MCWGCAALEDERKNAHSMIENGAKGLKVSLVPRHLAKSGDEEL